MLFDQGFNVKQHRRSLKILISPKQLNFCCDMAADDSPFFDNDMPTMRSSSSSSEGLPHGIAHNWEGSVESNEVSTQAADLETSTQFFSIAVTDTCTVFHLHQDSDQSKKSSSRRVNKGHHLKGKSRHGSSDAAHTSGTGNGGMRLHVGPPPSYSGPKVSFCFCCFSESSFLQS